MVRLRQGESFLVSWKFGRSSSEKSDPRNAQTNEEALPEAVSQVLISAEFFQDQITPQTKTQRGKADGYNVRRPSWE
ncbi:hypothetical protein SKAU_G00340010 [Synaphobranchus kaupii]|uniref:Uncharacterized protein n=1 Tax=Synaphobranchus kaupii TaxID=118154 RepID=A0A9Q1EN04_SYNKA|nr:hypothetical protein SKAU_G00340010 [Synaphobranchus kaupii]